VVGYIEAAKKCLNMVYSLALVGVKDNFDAENVTKKVFAKYSRNYRKLKDEEHVRIWFICAVIRCCKSAKYSDKYRVRNTRDESIDVMMYASKADNNRELMEYLKIRPLLERIAVHLMHYEDMTIEQISSILSARKKIIEQWVRRAAEIQAEKWANVPTEQTPAYKERYNQFMRQFFIRNSVAIDISHILIDVKVMNVNTPLKGYRIRPAYIIFWVTALAVALAMVLFIQAMIRENPQEIYIWLYEDDNDCDEYEYDNGCDEVEGEEFYVEHLLLE